MSENKTMDRREFIRCAGLFGLAGAAVVLLPACSKEKAEEAASKPHDAIQAAKEATDPCTDISNLTPEERATRTTFKYESPSKDPAKLCATCNFWIPDPEGGLCGTCTLVKGPINPKGSCMSWAKKITTG